MTPIAHVAIPAWGARRVPVLAIDGETWTVQGPHTRTYPTGRRELHVAALDLSALCPARVALVATRGESERHSPAIAASVKGAEWMEARAARVRALRVCSAKGWRVVANTHSSLGR